MGEPLECTEPEHLDAGAPGRNPEPSDYKVGDRKEHDCAENQDRASPMPQHFVKIAPNAPGRLHQYAGCLVGNVDASFDARSLLQQALLTDGARLRIDRRALR